MEHERKIAGLTTVEKGVETLFFKLQMHALFVKDMNGNSHLKKPRGMICDTDTAYVQTFKVKSKTAGKIIELRCPSSQAISVFGKYQTISLRCFDKHNREPDPATRINFRKVSKYGGISRLCRAAYGDLSPTKAIKYSFAKGLYLSGEEVLELEVLDTDTDTDTDIERIEFKMEADIFEMFGQDTQTP